MAEMSNLANMKNLKNVCMWQREFTNSRRIKGIILTQTARTYGYVAEDDQITKRSYYLRKCNKKLVFGL